MITFTTDALSLTFPRRLNGPCCYVCIIFITQIWSPRKNRVPESDIFPVQLHVLTGKLRRNEGSFSRKSETRTVLSDHDLTRIYCWDFNPLSDFTWEWCCMEWSGLMSCGAHASLGQEGLLRYGCMPVLRCTPSPPTQQGNGSTTAKFTIYFCCSLLNNPLYKIT
jgi:hypothetical protein